MPNIKGYEAPNDLGLRPTEMGVDARAAVARRGGAFFNQVADAQNQMGSRIASTVKDVGDVALKYAEHEELSKGAASFAVLQDNITKQWNETAKSADPNDSTIAQKFREEVVAPALEKYAGSFNTEAGQKWAESHTDSLRQHVFTKTAADMSSLAATAVKQNYTTTVNTLSSTVRNDPSSLDFTLKTAESSISAMADSSPNLDATASAKVKSELLLDAKTNIVKSWLTGVAEKNPDQATKIIEGGKYAEYISGTDAKTIIGYARTNARLAKSEENSTRVMQDHVAKTDFNKAANDLELSTIPGGPMERPTLPQDYWNKIRELGQMPGASLDPGRLKTMVENGERITSRLGKPEPLGPVSHATAMDLITRMRATDGTRLETNDEIYKAYGENKLNTADFNFLNKEFKEMRSPEGDALSKDRAQFFKQYAGAIHGVGYDPAGGSTKLYQAEMDARRVEKDLRQRGIDPHQAYDPSSENFIGKPANLQKWQGSMQLDLQDRASRNNVNLTANDSKITGVETKDATPITRDAPRTVGKTYMTPQGELKWTGTGWVKP